tara:strand:- start:4104 stop:6194 length:2091 start_codon:yes stop_codon:yes gene_type:complete
MLYSNFYLANLSPAKFLLCVVFSFFATYLMYRKHYTLNDLPKTVHLSLFSIRFLIFFILCLILLNIQIMTQQRISKSPKIVFLQDNSRSVLSTSDSIFFKKKYTDLIDSLFKSKKIDFDVISFDKTIKAGFSNFDGNLTDFSNVINRAKDLYSNENIVAYILSSDGIYNSGINPVYEDINLNAPLHCIFIGDSVTKNDIYIDKVSNNNFAYLGNSFKVNVLLKAKKLKGSEIYVKLYDLNEDDSFKNLIKSKTIKVNNSNFSTDLIFDISSQEVGLNKYKIILDSNSNEQNKNNNEESFFIDVIDNRKKILILFSDFHPDIAALKNTLESFDQYVVESVWEKDLQQTQDIKKYDLVILHQLSKLDEDIDLILQSTPKWYILGKNSQLDDFSLKTHNISFQEKSNFFENVEFSKNLYFNSFEIDDSLNFLLSISNNLLVPFNTPTINNLSEVLLYKKVGGLITKQPIFFFTTNNINSAYLIGEGLWRLKLNSFEIYDNNSVFDRFISNIIQSILVDENKKRFDVKYKPIYSFENGIDFSAHLYDKNYDLTNKYDVELSVKDENGNNYVNEFLKNDNRFFLKINLPVGNYSFIAKTNLNDKNLIDSGKFTVVSPDIESRITKGNINFLNNLASKHDGLFFELKNLNKLTDTIIESESYKSKIDTIDSLRTLLDKVFILIALLFLMISEWIVRRRYINF